MQPTISSIPTPRVSRLVFDEIRLSWAFIRGDFTAAVLPLIIFSGTAWKATGASRPILSILGAMAYAWLYAYTFCLSNQFSGIEEDRANKPTRPLVVGRASIRGAKLRYLAASVAFVALGAVAGSLLFALLWVAVTVLHNQLALARYWPFKHAAMGLGVVAQLGAAWSFFNPLTESAWRWIVMLAIFVAVVHAIQDLRDIDGDLLAGRRTLPIAMGESAARKVLAGLLMPLSIGFALWAVLPAGGIASWLGSLLLTLLAGTISIRMLLLRTKRSDQTTYILLTGWYCLALLISFVLA